MLAGNHEFWFHVDCDCGSRGVVHDYVDPIVLLDEDQLLEVHPLLVVPVCAEQESSRHLTSLNTVNGYPIIAAVAQIRGPPDTVKRPALPRGNHDRPDHDDYTWSD